MGSEDKTINFKYSGPDADKAKWLRIGRVCLDKSASIFDVGSGHTIPYRTAKFYVEDGIVKTTSFDHVGEVNIVEITAPKPAEFFPQIAIPVPAPPTQVVREEIVPVPWAYLESQPQYKELPDGSSAIVPDYWEVMTDACKQHQLIKNTHTLNSSMKQKVMLHDEEIDYNECKSITVSAYGGYSTTENTSSTVEGDTPQFLMTVGPLTWTIVGTDTWDDVLYGPTGQRLVTSSPTVVTTTTNVVDEDINTDLGYWNQNYTAVHSEEVYNFISGVSCGKNLAFVYTSTSGFTETGYQNETLRDIGGFFWEITGLTSGKTEGVFTVTLYLNINGERFAIWTSPPGTAEDSWNAICPDIEWYVLSNGEPVLVFGLQYGQFGIETGLVENMITRYGMFYKGKLSLSAEYPSFSVDVYTNCYHSWPGKKTLFGNGYIEAVTVKTSEVINGIS